MEVVQASSVMLMSSLLAASYLTASILEHFFKSAEYTKDKTLKCITNKTTACVKQISTKFANCTVMLNEKDKNLLPLHSHLLWCYNAMQGQIN